LGVGLPQLAGRHHVVTGRHRRRRARLRESFPGADDTRVDIQLATELRHRLLAAQDSLHRLPLELRAEHPPAICLPPMFAHGASPRILRPQDEQPKGGALQYGHRDSTLLMLAYRHGLRVGELVALRWEQVDLTAGLLHVARLKRGLASTHPLRGSEIRALR